MDIPCPHCGRLNETQREFCWACFKPLAPETAPPAGPAAPGGASVRAERSDASFAPPETPPFRIGPLILRSRGMYLSEPLDAPPDVPMAPPPGFRLDDDGLERSVSWRWLSWAYFRTLFFAAVSSVPFAFVFYIYRNSPPNSWAPGLALKTLGALGALPAVFLYAWLAGLVNRTTLRLDAARVSIRHGPLPWLGGRDVFWNEIARVFGEKLTSNPIFNSDGTPLRPRVMYAVGLLLKNGKTVKLTKGLLAPEHARFVGQQLRKPA